MNPSWRNGVYRDVEGGKREGKGMCQRVNAAFGRAVALCARFAHEVAGGAEVDDAPVGCVSVLLPVYGQEVGCNECWAQVGADNLVKLFYGGFCDGVEKADSGIVDEDVEVAPLHYSGLQAVFELYLVGYICEVEYGTCFFATSFPRDESMSQNATRSPA